MIGIDARLEQQPHVVRMPLLSRRDQCRPMKQFVSARSAPAASTSFRIAVAPLGAGKEVRRVVDRVLGIHVGAGFDQHLRGRLRIGVRRNQQRGRATLVANLDVLARNNHLADARHVIGPRRGENRSVVSHRIT